MNPEVTFRGLVIISALLNFIDWLDKEGAILDATKQQRADLVLEFLASHSKRKNYFMQADDIANRLGVPLREENPGANLPELDS